VEKLKLSRLREGDVIAWDEVSARYHFVRTATVSIIKGRNIFVDSGNVLWAPDLRGLRIATESDVQESR
jgi:hypothetical protein